ncbi:putative DNA-directed RNA polymerases I, II, and III subunit RPABC1 [Monocercomonoides exilis]|uniref:putative DNA-directed RNA polymerases I, II, and III subunit RPABC1 n=1 Tax=Monocercomonoides exilis TaxID=2049356 RepID=UPI003559F497|nr:putative DNA-directed RNA polymerases I, II, and III subunit RPABC1 [Monocercomonoides exilis]|eukprot:MONOS_15047.1-p1 / transcript=MONOS_15047.1 / gene=MONOS_15047 / organism=Monocercomonoides_exilis_PA203 / gene_product=DNA-directed RNA polymerases I, II, and III subunit RPABC1 / transcript_product=DNA-directed RNA polymerases I, II, and III subunit RPABC1 / location=Mono_scaffold01133:6101-7067(+) / protein_length=206 / sequence_SO=supercontig / SO=protein_coding / is_pseudo=false
MATQATTVEHLYRIRRTVWQMLDDRGYNVSKEHLEMTLATFRDQLSGSVSREDLTILASHRVTNEHVMVFFCAEPKVRIISARKYIQYAKDEGVKHAILIAQEGFLSHARDFLAALALKGYTIEQFLESELRVNVTKHILVPQHIPLSDEQKAALLTKYKVKEAQLPRIQQADPVAKYFGLKKGQVVKIVRPSETAGRYVTYRIVV